MSQTTGSPRRTEIKQIFLDLCDLPPHDRAPLLHARCGDDAELRALVQSLLDAHDVADEAHAGPTLSHLSHNSGATPAAPQQSIGQYQILAEIGEGGFAHVYLAEQRAPVRRRVALKILKLGMDSRQVLARFDAERQALAMMDHPGIAKVFDAGATRTGRPYFVMELVEGVPVTRYCDENNLNIPQRLELFAQICGAVQHAHQKGIIHRDIKPSNVLVSANDGQPPLARVIDFGIANASHAWLL
jgi:serine/threonine protein kinase